VELDVGRLAWFSAHRFADEGGQQALFPPAAPKVPGSVCPEHEWEGDTDPWVP